ncbi:ABC transporter A family member 10-like [Physella acuta]|uniref:ABC transporter A family member 10-like n=1 Tax=Physella acuta TaxID=109671 RepID=UPI0027DE129A|nr:ABC transporter A family member 10-like [Physella acuta]
MASFWQQLKALLWRNILLKKRKKSMLFQEFFYPVYFVAILAIVKRAIKPDVKPAMTFPVNNLTDLRFNNAFNLKHDIYVVPNTAQLKNWMADIVTQLPGNLSYQMFATVEEAETAYRHNSSSVLAGIIFSYKNNKYSYALRVGYHPANTVCNTRVGPTLAQCTYLGQTLDKLTPGCSQDLYMLASLDTLIFNRFYLGCQDYTDLCIHCRNFS